MRTVFADSFYFIAQLNLADEAHSNPSHVQYQKAFERELRKKGKHNPDIRRNY
jgi:hypothetical protein